MKKVNVKLAAALFAAISSFLICSCGSKIQTPRKIELVRPEKPTDAKYFETKLNNDNTVSIVSMKLEDMINDDVYENILVPATIEGIPVSTVTIKCGSHNIDTANKNVQKKALCEKYKDAPHYYIPQRLEFEEGIKRISLTTQAVFTFTADKTVFMWDFDPNIKSFIHDFSISLNEEENHKLEQTFGLREIVFPDSVERITGSISGIALEKVKFPANLKRLDCDIAGLYYNNPEVVYPTSKFVVYGTLFSCFKADEFVIPDAISDIVVPNSAGGLDDWDYAKIKKLVLPKNLNVAMNFKINSPLNEIRTYFLNIEEIVVPDNATLTTRSSTPNDRGNNLWLWRMSSGLKKFSLGKNATMDIFNFRPAKELSEFNIGEGAKINFDYAKKYGPNYFLDCTKLSISSQQKLKEIGYEGSF